MSFDFPKSWLKSNNLFYLEQLLEKDSVLDRYSKGILAELQRNARQTIQQIAETIGLSSTPCWKRLKAMEEEGIIHRYTVSIDRERIGLHNCVLAEVNLSTHNESVVEAFEAAVRDCAAVVECYSTTGQADYVLKVITPDIKAYDDFLHRTVFRLPGVSGIRSAIVLREVKSNAGLPLDF